MNDTKELISSIEKVRSYCHNQENCLHCIFYDIDLVCCNIQGIPDEWIYNRFSQDEVRLAKALKKYGVSRIARKGPVAYWGTKDGFGGYLPKGMFEILGFSEGGFCNCHEKGAPRTCGWGFTCPYSTSKYNKGWKEFERIQAETIGAPSKLPQEYQDQLMSRFCRKD